MSSSALRELCLIGFLGGQATGEASTEDVASGAFLGCGEGVDAVECFGADAEALHLPGGLRHASERSTTLDNVSQRDTVLVVRQDNYTEVARKQQTGRLARAWNTAPAKPVRGSAIGMTLGDEVPTRKGTHRPAPRKRTRSVEPGSPLESGLPRVTDEDTIMDDFCFCGTCGECIWEQESFNEAAEAERRYERHLETNEQYRDEVEADLRRVGLGGL